MPWIKVPVEHHPIFRAALPGDPRVETLLMFGGIAAKVNGHIFAGLFARSAIVNLGIADRDEALALDGATYFDPMGNGRMQSEKILLPEDVLHDPHDLRDWLARAFAYTASLPPKAAKRSAKQAVAKEPVVKTPRTKASAGKTAVGKTAVGKSAVAKKPAARKPVGQTPTKRRSRR